MAKSEQSDNYPWWTDVIGWAMAGSSMSFIPCIAIWKIINTPGTLREVATINAHFLIQFILYKN